MLVKLHHMLLKMVSLSARWWCKRAASKTWFQRQGQDLLKAPSLKVILCFNSNFKTLNVTEDRATFYKNHQGSFQGAWSFRLSLWPTWSQTAPPVGTGRKWLPSLAIMHNIVGWCTANGKEAFIREWAGHPDSNQLHHNARSCDWGGTPLRASCKLCKGSFSSKAEAIDAMGGGREEEVLQEGTVGQGCTKNQLHESSHLWCATISC